jgi:hypothetical protein
MTQGLHIMKKLGLDLFQLSKTVLTRPLISFRLAIPVFKIYITTPSVFLNPLSGLGGSVVATYLK